MIPVSKEEIKEFGGRILGYIETDAQGNQQVREFGGRILGTYDKTHNCTREFGGRIISNGNILASLLYRNRRR